MDTIANINPGSIALFVGCAVGLIAGIIIYARNTMKKSNQFFFLLAVFTALWSLSVGLFEMVNVSPWEHIFLLMVYVSSATIPIALLFFALALAIEKIDLSPLKLSFIAASYILITIAIVWDGFVIADVGRNDGLVKEIIFGNGFPLLVFYLALYLLWSLIILARRYWESAGIFKVELRNILLSSFIAITLAVTANLILPMMGIFKFFWWGPLFAIGEILLIGYLVIRYNFWNIKLVATELFASLIVLTLVIEILLASSLIDFVVKVAITLLVVFSSIFLIRSVRNEVEAKEEVEKLLKDLAGANEELQTLDKRKSEFLSIASHHLRDPLTAIKGYASMLIEGSFGQLSDGVKESMQKVFESSKRLVTIIDDFLNISQIEQGEMAYIFSSVDMKKLVGDIVEEISPSASRSGLWLHFLADGITNGDSVVEADVGKIRQMVTNLIDNSIKYTPKGGVRVVLERKAINGNVRLLLSVTDTGIGMDSGTIEKIFNKFSRAEGVSKLYTDGSGLGLYIAKEILKKHNGRIWAESQGLGKGSTFFVELPIGGQKINT